MAYGKAYILKDFFIAIFRATQRRVFWSFVAGALLFGLLWIPFASIVSMLIALPLLTNVPGFDSTGVHVTYWFMGFFPKSGTAYVLCYLYYSFVAYLCLFPLARTKSPCA